MASLIQIKSFFDGLSIPNSPLRTAFDGLQLSDEGAVQAFAENHGGFSPTQKRAFYMLGDRIRSRLSGPVLGLPEWTVEVSAVIGGCVPTYAVAFPNPSANEWRATDPVFVLLKDKVLAQVSGPGALDALRAHGQALIDLADELE
ncbi:MAG: hypothetical protein VX836_00485 [Pseudomonadota bacterium]|nr:hypothetical protein [Pseudomonadota bacterium]